MWFQPDWEHFYFPQCLLTNYVAQPEAILSDVGGLECDPNMFASDARDVRLLTRAAIRLLLDRADSDIVLSSTAALVIRLDIQQLKTRGEKTF